MAAAPITLLLSEGGEAAATFLGLPHTFWQTLNLLGFIALLVWLLRRPLVQFFENRRREVPETLRKAEEDRARAEAIAKELGERLSRIEVEIEALRAHAREQAEAEE
ncbi:MAG: ATP synthase F0 subunit B, partial [Acidithiobacillales bacterium]